MHCTSCGSDISPGSDFCTSCGVTFNPAGYAGYPVPRRTSGMAIASLVISIVGFFMCFFIFQIVAVIFGILAKKEISESQGMVEGDGLAVGGIVIGIVGLVRDFLIIFIWGAMIFFPFMLA